MFRPTPLCLLLVAACATPEGLAPSAAIGTDEVPSTPERTPGGYAETDDTLAAQPALRALFPELDGEITRESIALLLAGRETDQAPDTDRVGRAVASLEAGRLVEAHALLGELLTEDLVARATELLAAGNARDALTVLDDAADVSPRSPEVLLLRAEGELAIGLEVGDSTFLEDALGSFRSAGRLGDDPRAWVGASRAARELFRTDEAIDYARRALRGSGGTAIEASISIGAQRALAQATFDKYRTGKQEDEDSALVQELFETTHRALATYVDRSPLDPWGWTQLANLFEWQGSLTDARRVLLEGLDSVPADRTMHGRLTDVSRRLGGSKALYEAYDEFRSRHPDEALGVWFPAVERFEEAVAGYNEGEDTSPGFEAALDAFEDCRELQADYEEACTAYELVCLSGIGWCRLRGGDLEDARTSFFKMHDVKQDGGLTYEVNGLRSGVQGFALVADASYKRGQDPNSLERATHMERASKIFDFLHTYEELNLAWANNAGFFNRDTAVLFEQRASALARQGEIEKANRLLVRAREMMERSFLAYLDACELASDNVRIVNDTGLILTYYLQREVPLAEELLMQAVQLGEEQVPEARQGIEGSKLEQQELADRRNELETLEVALGDAYENLGVLHLTLKGQPEVARGWFTKAVEEGGPDPRPIVDHYLMLCEQAEQGELDPVVREATRWAAPINTGR